MFVAFGHNPWDQKNQSSYRGNWALVCSLALHALLLMNYFFNPKDPLQFGSSTQAPPIEVIQAPSEWLKAAPQKKTASRIQEKQVVQTEQAIPSDLDPNARFLSDRNQKALEETRAKVVDDFRAKQGEGLKGQAFSDQTLSATGAETQSLTSPLEIDASDGITPELKSGIQRNWKTLSIKDLSVNGDGSPEAASDDALRNIREGSHTVLATREFKYFSYYNRIKDMLRQHWKPMVERQMAHLSKKGKTIQEAEFTTRVQVLLDEKGLIQNVTRSDSSGIEELDIAAMQAFKQAAPFPNPPQGLIEKDGFVRIQWEFVLTTQAAPSIQWRGPGNGRARNY